MNPLYMHKERRLQKWCVQQAFIVVCDDDDVLLFFSPGGSSTFHTTTKAKSKSLKQHPPKAE
jgi:hypothetical protein